MEVKGEEKGGSREIEVSVKVEKVKKIKSNREKIVKVKLERTN